MGGTGEPSAIRWEVAEDMIDLDHWATVYVDTVRNNSVSNVTRWGLWPFFVVFAAAVIATAITDPILALVPLAIGALTYGLVTVLNRGAARRTAQKLRDVPAASEPFTFVADESGTHSRGESQSGEASWRRYKSVALKDELVMLTRDDDAILPLPTAGLIGASPSEAVAAISGWISEAAG